MGWMMHFSSFIYQARILCRCTSGCFVRTIQKRTGHSTIFVVRSGISSNIPDSSIHDVPLFDSVLNPTSRRLSKVCVYHLRGGSAAQIGSVIPEFERSRL